MPLSTVARDAAAMLGYGHENADALWKQFLIDGSVLVWGGTTNGKGSENYVDDARKLSPEHLKFIDDFICETHAAGGTVSVPTCADELAKGFPRLYVSEGCVRYAMVNYCDAGGGLVGAWRLHRRHLRAAGEGALEERDRRVLEDPRLLPRPIHSKLATSRGFEARH